MRITRAAGVALVLLAGFAAPFSAAAGGEEEGRGGGGASGLRAGGRLRRLQSRRLHLRRSIHPSGDQRIT